MSQAQPGGNPLTDADRRRLQRNLDRPLDDLMEELELYDPASHGRTAVGNKVAGPLRRRLRVESRNIHPSSAS
jgi:hypothetical protein